MFPIFLINFDQRYLELFGKMFQKTEFRIVSHNRKFSSYLISEAKFGIWRRRVLVRFLRKRKSEPGIWMETTQKYKCKHNKYWSWIFIYNATDCHKKLIFSGKPLRLWYAKSALMFLGPQPTQGKILSWSPPGSVQEIGEKAVEISWIPYEKVNSYRGIIKLTQFIWTNGYLD